MLTYLRYALATICFALSVACLGLWWRSHLATSPITLAYFSSPQTVLRVAAFTGMAVIIELKSTSQLDPSFVEWLARDSQLGLFGRFNQSIYFPLWYPVLVFALAGVGMLCLGRRFTLRSAIIATTVVAGLLGMVVAL